MLVVDAHVHIGRLRGSPFEKMTLKEVCNALLSEMKKAGVAHAVILSTLRNMSTDTEEHVLDLVKGVSSFSIVGSFDVIEEKKNDISHLEMLMKKKQIVGIKLYPGYQQFYPNDKRCIPVYVLCQKFDLPVIFHSGDTLSFAGQVSKVKYSHPLHIDEVAADFPKLKIVIAHMGNPWLVDAAEVLYKNKNVYADISGLVVQEGMSTPYARLMRRRIQELALYASPNKLLFGTDWPLASMKSYRLFAHQLGFSKKDEERLFYKNASELFSINL